MLCSRAGVECVAAHIETSTRSNAGRTRNNGPSATQQAERSPRTDGDSSIDEQTRHSATTVSIRSDVAEHGLTKAIRPISSDEARWHGSEGLKSESSATMALVETVHQIRISWRRKLIHFRRFYSTEAISRARQLLLHFRNRQKHPTHCPSTI